MSDLDDNGGLADEVMSAAQVDGLYGDDDESGDSFSAEDAANAPMSRADEIVDQLLPEGFEWRRLVCTYPKTAMAVSLVGGLIVGRAQGAGLLAGLSGFAVGEFSRNLQEFVEDFGT